MLHAPVLWTLKASEISSWGGVRLWGSGMLPNWDPCQGLARVQVKAWEFPRPWHSDAAMLTRRLQAALLYTHRPQSYDMVTRFRPMCIQFGYIKLLGACPADTEQRRYFQCSLGPNLRVGYPCWKLPYSTAPCKDQRPTRTFFV